MKWSVLMGALLLVFVSACPAAAETTPVDTTSVDTTSADTTTVDSAVADTTETWLPAAAAADSLRRYWRNLDEDWLGDLPAELFDFGLDAARIDSLTIVGDDKVADLLAGRLWRHSIDPIGRLRFNRVEGWRPGVTVRLRKLGPHQPELTLGAGYGFARRRPILDATLTWPLIRKHRKLSNGLAEGRIWPVLTLQMSAEKTVRSFAGDGRPFRVGAIVVAGEDPNQYYERRSLDLKLILRLVPRLAIWAGHSREEHRSLPVVTDWNLLGRRDEVPGNWGVPALGANAWSAGLSFSWLRTRGWLDVHWHSVENWPEASITLPGVPLQHLRRLRVHLEGSFLEAHGTEFLWQGNWRAADRQEPLQWKQYLGDYSTLRSYPARELAGDQAGWASLDIRWGFDLWRALRVPGLKKLGLQPLSFVDWGRAIALDGSDEPAGADGWRVNAGVGFGKLIGVPGRQGTLRVYAGRPVLDGQRDRPWRFVVAFEL